MDEQQCGALQLLGDEKIEIALGEPDGYEYMVEGAVQMINHASSRVFPLLLFPPLEPELDV